MLRLLIGWFIVTVQFLPTVSIVLGYWVGDAFLMATKRFAEYHMYRDKNQARLYRKSFKYYSEKSLLLSSLFYALLSTFFCGIFMIDQVSDRITGNHSFLCGLNLCYKLGSSAQESEKLFREKRLLLYVLFFIVLISLLMLFWLPFVERYLFVIMPQVFLVTAYGGSSSCD